MSNRPLLRRKAADSTICAATRHLRGPILLLISIVSQITGADSPVVVDGKGRAIGYLLGGTSNCGGIGDLAVYTKAGFFTCVNQQGRVDSTVDAPGSDGAQFGVYFLSSDCSGAPYVVSGAGDFIGGFVIESQFGLYSVPHGAYSTYMSYFSNSAPPSMCNSTGTYSAQGIKADRNDPLATGVSGSPWQPPLTIEVLPDTALVDVVFFDSFETGY